MQTLDCYHSPRISKFQKSLSKLNNQILNNFCFVNGKFSTLLLAEKNLCILFLMTLAYLQKLTDATRLV